MWYDSEAQPEKLDFSSENSNQDGFKWPCSALWVKTGTIILIQMNSQTFTFFLFIDLLILSLTEIDNVTNVYSDQSKIILFSNTNNTIYIILYISIKNY